MAKQKNKNPEAARTQKILAGVFAVLCLCFGMFELSTGVVTGRYGAKYQVLSAPFGYWLGIGLSIVGAVYFSLVLFGFIKPREPGSLWDRKRYQEVGTMVLGLVGSAVCFYTWGSERFGGASGRGADFIGLLGIALLGFLSWTSLLPSGTFRSTIRVFGALMMIGSIFMIYRLAPSPNPSY